MVEPSGAAALAALLTGKVHFIYSTGKINYYVLISYSQLETLIGQDNLLGQRVVAVITGLSVFFSNQICSKRSVFRSNVTPEELVSMKSNEDE